MKVKVLLGTATVLALVWGGLVVNAVNNPIKTDEPQEKVVHVDAVEVVPETVSEPVHEVLEPEVVEVPVVEEADTIQKEVDCPAPVDGSLNAQVEALKACYRAE